jgi:hypothetical protein
MLITNKQKKKPLLLNLLSSVRFHLTITSFCPCVYFFISQTLISCSEMNAYTSNVRGSTPKEKVESGWMQVSSFQFQVSFRLHFKTEIEIIYIFLVPCYVARDCIYGASKRKGKAQTKSVFSESHSLILVRRINLIETSFFY